MDVMELRRRLMSLITHTSGGDPIPAGCEIGTFTPETDEYTHTISHSLGEIPKFAICLAVNNGSWSDMPSSLILFEDLMSDPQTGTFDISAAPSRKRNNVVSNAGLSVNTTNTYTTYPAAMSSTEVTFATGRYYGGKFFANQTYIYILTK